MKLITQAAFGLALTAFAAAPAFAQGINDVRCLLVSNLFAKAAKDPKQKTVAEISKYYYLGRIQGRLNAAQLKAQALVQVKSLTPKTAGAAMTACAKQLQASARSVEATLSQAAPKKK